ncbi:MAG: redoxin domain-containing protein [Acidobacteria bacterium]|nr:redoxin domain-containing protein [Acidobacteriota bacterium]
MHKLFLAALAASSLFLLSGCGDSAPSVATEVAEASEGEAPKPAPDFTLEAVDGKQVKLSDYKGQVVLLNFWATWCGPCKIEMPWFIEFQRKYKDQGFTVLAVSLDEEGWEVVRPYAENLKPNFPLLLGNDQIDERFDGIVALPTTLIIDKEGRIVSRHTGLISKSDYESEIEGLL